MKIDTFINAFENDKKYLKFKKRYLNDTSNTRFERDVRESFKCIIACDYINLLEKTGYMQTQIEIPQRIFDGLECGMIPNVSNTVSCISEYTLTRNPQYCSCKRSYTEKLRNNGNHRFSVYYARLTKDAQRELKSYKCYFDEDTFRKYKAALIVFKVFFNVFYFKALPKKLEVNIFNRCVSECAEFAKMYKFDEINKIYIRKRFKRRAALIFNDGVAWELVYNELHRFKLVGDLVL